MIEKKYLCDLCRDVYDPNKGNLFGLYWNLGDRLEIRPPKTNGTEHHICRSCLVSLKEQPIPATQ